MDFKNVTVVLPSLNPDRTLCQVVDSLLAEGFEDVILVNDGSDGEHLAPFLEADEHPEVTLLTHPVNRGKGAAMKTAFAFILENRRDSAGAVTVDGDGQHTAPDVRACAQRMVDEGDKVVLGCRDFSGAGVPWKSRAGNTITCAVFRLFCGISSSDTQTGLRAIPFQWLPLMLETAGERYEFETEMFFSLKRAHVGVAEQKIATVYEPGNPSSHFHPFRDSWAIYRRIFSFAASSGISFLVDYGLFTLLNLQFTNPAHPLYGLSRGWRLFWAYFGARAVSSLVNYTLNQRAVFRSSEPTRKTIVRYYILCVLQAAVSYRLLTLASTALHAAPLLETVLKLAVDFLLFLISFRIQQSWVFSKSQEVKSRGSDAGKDN